jgi:glycosyltransferase involved in cell wall biosynthesis
MYAPIRLARGDALNRDADLSVVVLSYQNEATILDAIDSLRAQSPCVEIIVSHSGGGPTAGLLARERPDVRVLATDERRSCSEARNIGIRACRTPFIAFLEADCVAEPGWVEGRLREHRAGADVVASAITNAFPGSRSAWASHLLRYQQRFPDTPPSERLLLGLSCHRDAFERFGCFREDLPGGEDSEFTGRILTAVDIVWAGDVRTAHRNATSPVALVKDHYRRGVRNAHTQLRLNGSAATLAAAREALENVPRALRWARRIDVDSHGVDPLRAWPLLAPATAAYIAGLVAGRFAGR